MPRLAILVCEIGSVAHQPADLSKFAIVVHCGEGMARCQRGELHAAVPE